MDTGDIASDAAASRTPAARRLSYKFERLRERIRAAIDAGELVGKLPGERSLARHFNVNAKTLSKALTDLAAEGVLQRNIGLGTFVRGLAEPGPALRVLLVGDAPDGLSAALAGRGLSVQTAAPADALPPSLLSRQDVVVVDSAGVPDDVVRGLVVRGLTVITLGRQGTPYSTHALMPHASRSARDAAVRMVARGHRSLTLVPDDPADDSVAAAVREAVPQAKVRVTTIDDFATTAGDGPTAVVCGSGVVARTMALAAAAGLGVPDALPVIAYGRVRGPANWCGYFVTDEQLADAVADLLSAGPTHQPVTLWLAGRHESHGTAWAADGPTAQVVI